MPKPLHYDIVIIGAGSSGFSAAEAAKNAGASVCLIEKEKLGGECPNFACVPSKALLKAAKTYRLMKHAKEFGISCKGIEADFNAIMDYRKGVVDTITGGGERGDRYIEIAKKLGIDVEIGIAEFVDESTISVGEKLLKAKAIIIAVGTNDFIPPIPGLDQIKPLTWKRAIQLKRQPKSMAIIGGGPVGSELATFFSAFGTRVMLFQGAPTILNREDEEVAKLAHESLRSLGVEVYGNAEVKEIVNASGGVNGVKVEVNGKMETHAVESILIATGKRAAIEGLGLEEIGVDLDERGSIKTNAEQRTSVKHIFSAGDVDGGMQFTHTAHREGSIAGLNAALVAKNKRSGFEKADMRVVPRVTFIEPEVASVGMTAKEAKEKYNQVLVGRCNVATLGRAVTESSRYGLVKIIAHPKTRKVLGCHIISERAGEMIHEAALAMHVNATIDKIGSMIHAFPTYSEGLTAAANSAKME